MLGERVQARKSLAAPDPHVGDYFNSLLSVIVRRCEIEVDLAFLHREGHVVVRRWVQADNRAPH